MTDSLPGLLVRLNVPRHHVVLCTDGSGTVGTRPGGYAALIVHPRERKLVFRHGAAAAVTSQEAELRAVQEAVWYFMSQKFTYRPNGYHVVHLTDSKYVADKLKAIQDDPTLAFEAKSHKGIWISLQTTLKLGIRLHSFHVPRNSNPLMKYVDDTSRVARKAFEEAEGAFVVSYKKHVAGYTLR